MPVTFVAEGLSNLQTHSWRLWPKVHGRLRRRTAHRAVNLVRSEDHRIGKQCNVPCNPSCFSMPSGCVNSTSVRDAAQTLRASLRQIRQLARRSHGRHRLQRNRPSSLRRCEFLRRDSRDGQCPWRLVRSSQDAGLTRRSGRCASWQYQAVPAHATPAKLRGAASNIA